MTSLMDPWDKIESDVSAEVRQRASNIRLAVFDVDGVLTDGSVTFSDEGRELKSFNTKDGYGMQQLQSSGITVAIITGRSSPMVERRMKALGIDHVYQGKQKKWETCEKLVRALNLTPEQVCCTGDDELDLAIMERVGLACAPADAMGFVRERAHFVTGRKGGYGAGREVCDLLIAAASPP